jgi:peptidase E
VSTIPNAKMLKQKKKYLNKTKNIFEQKKCGQAQA